VRIASLKIYNEIDSWLHEKIYTKLSYHLAGQTIK